jgi:hypothetical protein
VPMFTTSVTNEISFVIRGRGKSIGVLCYLWILFRPGFAEIVGLRMGPVDLMMLFN